jgi:AAHS family 4-hydroxybenzoate transporter-like MFS transporter
MGRRPKRSESELNKNDPTNKPKFILITCLLLMIMDGYDIQSMAYAAPMIIEEWGVQKSMLGIVFSASLFGLFVGSFLLSSLSDR